MVSPTELALASVDLALQTLSPDTPAKSIGQYFPDLNPKLIEKVSKAREALKVYVKPNDQEILKIRKYIKHFHS